MQLQKTISAVEARVHFGEVMKRSFKDKVRYTVEKSGIPMVVIINADEYAHLVEEREERFKILDRIRDKAPLLSSSVVDKDVNKAVHSVRRKHA